MSDLKHTPGPWAVRPVYFDTIQIVSGPNGDQFAFAEVLAGLPTSAANARLIAAAPDLLAALIEARDLIEMLAFVDREPAEGSVGHRIRAAIAKATQP